MSESAWVLFPVPTITKSGIDDGSLVAAPTECRACSKRVCVTESVTDEEARSCHRGFAYARLSDERVAMGFVSPVVQTTSKGRKNYRSLKAQALSTAAADKIIAAGRSAPVGLTRDFLQARKELLDDLGRDPEMQKAIADQLGSQFEETLAETHDFMQLVNTVKQNVEVALRQKHQGKSVTEAADCEPILGAIYYAVELMSAKVDALKFHRNPALVHAKSTPFTLHAFMLKYKRLYNSRARAKNVDLRLEGETYAKVSASADAVGAIIHSLLDNMVKYAPAGSMCTIQIKETSTRLDVRFHSLGPLIEIGERTKIFLSGQRASAARGLSETGQGLGLSIAKTISDELKLGLEVQQDPDPSSRFPQRYSTAFSFSLPKHSGT